MFLGFELLCMASCWVNRLGVWIRRFEVLSDQEFGGNQALEKQLLVPFVNLFEAIPQRPGDECPGLLRPADLLRQLWCRPEDRAS